MDTVEHLRPDGTQVGDTHLLAVGLRAAETAQPGVVTFAVIRVRLDNVRTAVREGAEDQLLLVGLTGHILNLQYKHGGWIRRIEAGDVFEQIVLTGPLRSDAAP